MHILSWSLFEGYVDSTDSHPQFDSQMRCLPKPPASGPAGICLALLATIILPRVGNAATIYVGNSFDIEATFLVAISPELRAFTLQAVGKNGAQPRVFDSTKSGQGGTGITTADSRLHQVWEGGFVPTPTLNLVAPASIPQSLDSHFLVDTSSLFITHLPAENRPLVDPALHPFAGYGSFLTGTFALVGPASSTWNFAYIVVPAGTKVDFNFELGAAGFASEPIMKSLTMTFAPGDVNMDGTVDILDINLISSNWGGMGPAGDANGDGIVDIFDINLVSTDWSFTPPPPSAPAAVPEPGAFALATLGVLAVLARSSVRNGLRAVEWRGRDVKREARRPRIS
jgi:hypothetical protein